jgi:hypothetical protein
VARLPRKRKEECLWSVEEALEVSTAFWAVDNLFSGKVWNGAEIQEYILGSRACCQILLAIILFTSEYSFNPFGPDIPLSLGIEVVINMTMPTTVVLLAETPVPEI